MSIPTSRHSLKSTNLQALLINEFTDTSFNCDGAPENACLQTGAESYTNFHSTITRFKTLASV